MSPAKFGIRQPYSIEPELNDSERIINAEPKSFCDQFNRSPFQFSHNLAEHPLFQLPRLVELAEFVVEQGGSDKVACLLGKDIPIGCKWSDRPRKENFAEVISNLEESGSTVLIDAELDPEYRALANQILTELELLTDVPLRQQITWFNVYIIMGSPNAVTNYHIDHESNFLLQIHGEKEDYLFEQDDRSVLTEQELERFYIGDVEAATYKVDSQSKSTLYRLKPGTGVHHPVNAPHWVRTTSDSYAVTFSIAFYMRSFDLQARIYQVNHFLRKLGLTPTPPGKSAPIDQIKISAIGLFSKRQPSSKPEVVRSGVIRIKNSLKWVKKLLKR